MIAHVWSLLTAEERARAREARAPRGKPLPALAYVLHAAMGLPLVDDYLRSNSGATPVYEHWEERLAALMSGTYQGDVHVKTWALSVSRNQHANK